MAKADKQTKAEVKYAQAQDKEAAAREKGPRNHGADLVEVAEAKKEQIEAILEAEEAAAGKPEDTVTLVGPNDKANVTDANGVKFVNGKAEDVPQSLAERYVADLDGYSIQGGKGK